MALASPATIDDLDVQSGLYFAALLAAQEHRLPVAPTKRMTLAVMNLLREQALIEVPWPEQRWGVQPEAEETPIEDLQWRYRWTAYLREELLAVLKEYLQRTPRDDYGLTIRLRLWSELSVAEAEQFFAKQLSRHQFDAVWAQDLVFVHRNTHPALSIAQWRYCCWAATRHGASVAQQQRAFDAIAVREAIYVELKRRVSHVSIGTWGNCSFLPHDLVPESALGRLFTGHLTHMGADFWTAPPSVEHLFVHKEPS